MKGIVAALIAGLAGLVSVGLVGNAQAETVVSVAQTSYNYLNQPVCSAVRMNPTIYGSLPSDPCSLGTEGSYGPDRITKNTYDAAGQLTEVDKAYASSVQYAYARYTYNANGTKATEADANNNLTAFGYDGFDRLVAMDYPSTTAGSGTYNTADYEQYGYDANGNRTSWRRRDGNTIYYSYDNLNRQTLKDLPGGSAQDVYTGYDALGRIAYRRFASTSGAGVSYAYDSLGRVSSTTDMNGRAIYLAYNQASQRTSLAFPDLQAQGYYYNADASPNATTTAGNVTGVWYGYDVNGRLTSFGRPNNANTNFGYDGVGRLTGMSQDFNGAANDIAWTFAYNPAHQIVTSGASSTVFDYKQTTTTTDNRAYDGLNRDASIASIGGYDARQNLTSEGSGGRTFTYDIENRLLTTTGGSANLTLTYDPEGRLSSYTAGSSTTTFLYDGTNLIAEYDGTGAMLTRYMHAFGVDQPWVSFSGSGVGASNATYLYANYQGSIIATADMSGNVTNLYKYGPYGEPKNSANADSWSGSRFRYTGQIMLPEAMLYYYKARVYDPMYGRFLQSDPIGSKDDLDLYEYTGDDPINGTDPTGLYQNNGNSRGQSDPCGDDFDRTSVCSGSGGSAAQKVTFGAAGAAIGLAVGTVGSGACDWFTIGTCAVANPALVGGSTLLGAGTGVAVSNFVDTIKPAMQEMQGLVNKASGELARIEQRQDLGPKGVMYALVARSEGNYPNVRGGFTHLGPGDVWKFGETTTNYRYSTTLLNSLNVSYRPLYVGTQMQAKLAEKYALYNHFLDTGSLPPGNKIFR